MMKFIHKLTIVLALGGICGLAACSDDDQGFLKRNLREMSFPYVESSDTFTIRATGDWQISDTPDSREWTNAYGWVHVDQLSGKGDPGTYQKVTVTCDQNTSEERNATIYLHGCGEENVAIAIRQDNGIFEWKPFDNGQQFDVSGMLKLNAEAGAKLRIPYIKALGTDIIFKASFDKANRTSIRSYRGVGMEQGLQMLADVRSKWGLRLLTDIHESWQAAPVGEVVDVIQIPAFLCRQTDLLVAAAKTGRTVNIKKAQFLSGEDMRYPYEKACDAGAADVWLTERGNSFGYNNLVVDFRNIPDMLRIAPTVVMDCTHSVQRPGAAGGKTGGNREFVPAMALAAKAFGANGYFFEVHPDPDHALSDGPNMLNLNDLEGVVKSLL